MYKAVGIFKQFIIRSFPVQLNLNQLNRTTALTSLLATVTPFPHAFRQAEQVRFVVHEFDRRPRPTGRAA